MGAGGDLSLGGGKHATASAEYRGLSTAAQKRGPSTSLRVEMTVFAVEMTGFGSFKDFGPAFQRARERHLGRETTEESWKGVQ